MKEKEAWEKGIVTGKDNYSSKEIWAGRTPRQAPAQIKNFPL